MEIREPSYTVGGNVNWYNHYGEHKKLKTEPVIPLLGIYLEKNIIQEDTCSPMFIAALFTIAKMKLLKDQL